MAYDAVADFGFALPDPDNMWECIGEVENTANVLNATIAGQLTVQLQQIKNHVLDLQNAIHNAHADQLLSVFDTVERLGDTIRNDIDSVLTPIVGVARTSGVEVGGQGAGPEGAPATGSLSPVVTQSGPRLPFDSSSRYQPVYPEQSDYAWYCLLSPDGNSGCMAGTPDTLRTFTDQGYVYLSGPYRDMQSCSDLCGKVFSLATTGPVSPTSARAIGCEDSPSGCTAPGAGIPTGPTLPPGCVTSPTGQIVCGPTRPTTPVPPTPTPPRPVPPPLPPIPTPPPPPVPIDGPPPITGQQYYCVILPGTLTRVCYRSAQSGDSLKAAGFKVQGGPYLSKDDCQNDCVEETLPDFHYWCVRSKSNGAYSCVQSRTTLDNDGNVTTPTNVAWDAVAGPWRYQSACLTACHTPAPPPDRPVDIGPPPDFPRTRWYCVCNDQGHSLCVSVSGVTPQPPPIRPGERLCGGPFDTQEACLSACQTQPPPPPIVFYCICNLDNTVMYCFQEGRVPPPGFELCKGPFVNEAECEQLCKPQPPPPPPPAYWCIQGFNSLYCLRGVANVRPPGAISGPYQTEAECKAVCKLPTPPPPITPPTEPPTPPVDGPPPYPPPPGGGGLTTDCCEVDPDKKEADKESHTFRCWATCTGTQYITGPREPPKDINDSLVGTYESLEAAVVGCSGPKVCPTPPEKEKPGQKPPHQVGEPDWNNLDACEIFNSVQAVRGPGQGECSIAAMLGLDKVIEAQEGISVFNPLNIPTLITGGLAKLAKAVLCAVEDWTKQGGGDPCATPYQTMLDMAHAVNTWTERVAGTNNSRYKNKIDYTQNYLCPSVLPSGPEAIRAYLTNDITLEQLECWSRANGLLWLPTTKMVESLRTRHNAQDLTRLWLREGLTNDQFSHRVRELGYTKPTDVRELQRLAVQYPPYSDIIRLMVRDAGDERLVAKLGMDTDFEQKYTGDLQKWGQYAGIPNRVAQLLWRAHWSIPAAGQLFTIWQRERSRGDTIEGTQLGQDIKDALLQQDILPFWIPHLLNISYRPLGRIDIRRAYSVGSIDRDAMDRAYIAQGYSDATARTLTDYTVKNTRLALRSHNAVRSYMSFGLNRAQATDELRDYGASDDDIRWVLDWALTRMKAKSREVCVKGVKKRLNTGEVTEADARTTLRLLGLDPAQVELFIESWICELASKGKTPSAATLCKWLDAGLITGADMLNRLLLLGWDRFDASNLVAECERRIRIRLDNEERKRRKQQMADAAKEERDREKALKELEKQAKQRATALANAQRMKEQREAKMLVAADRLSDMCEIPASSAMFMVRDAVNYANKVLGLTLTESVNSAVEAAKDFEGETCAGYLDHAKDYAQATQAAEGNGNGAATA